MNEPHAPERKPLRIEPTDPADSRLLQRIAALYQAIDPVPADLVGEVLSRIRLDAFASRCSG